VKCTRHPETQLPGIVLRRQRRWKLFPRFLHVLKNVLRRAKRDGGATGCSAAGGLWSVP
jgi:hypothetical protein